MSNAPYKYENVSGAKYSFVSRGKHDLKKVVEFTQTHIACLYNLAFGDLLPDGSIDDKVVSNNGDISKVLATVISIINDFTLSAAHTKIMFFGSTEERTKLYHWILKRHYKEFSLQFSITALVEESGKPKEVPFEPNSESNYLAFFIRRNS